MLQQIEPTDEQLAFIKAIDDEESAAQFGRKLSTAQQLWCIEFVANGGQIVEAASKAGYASPLTSGHKNMVHKGCQELIRRLSVQNVNLMLPSLFARLYAIATDEKTSARAAVDAINTLIDRVVAPHPKGPSTAIQINNGAAGDGAGKGQAQIIIQELWTAREEREARRQAAHRAAGDIVDRQAARNVSDIDGRMSDKEDAALQLLEHIAEGNGVGGETFFGSRQVLSSIPVAQSSPLDKVAVGGVVEPHDKNHCAHEETISPVHVEDRSRGDGLLGVGSVEDGRKLWDDEDRRSDVQGDSRGADAGGEAATGWDDSASQLRQSAMREPEAFAVGDVSGQRDGRGGAGTSSSEREFQASEWGTSPRGEADGGEGSVYSEQPSRVQGAGSRAGGQSDEYSDDKARRNMEARNLAKEKNDDREYENEDAAPAGGDSALGPGRGEGDIEEGGGDAGGWFAEADAGGGGHDREILSGLQHGDVEGLCEDVSGDAGIADAGAGSGAGHAEVVWGPVGSEPATVVADSGTDAGPSKPAGSGGAIDIFADD